MLDLEGDFGLLPSNENQGVNEKDDIVKSDIDTAANIGDTDIFNDLQERANSINTSEEDNKNDNSDNDQDKPENKNEEVVTKEDPPSKENESDDEVTPEKVMYSYLVQEGFAEKVDKITPEVVSKAFDELPSSIFKSVVSSFPEHLQDLVMLGFNNPNLEKEDLVKFLQETRVEPVNLEDEDSVEKYVRQKVVNSGVVKEEDVNDYIDLLKEKGRLNSVGKEFYEKEEAAKTKLKQERLEAEERQRLQNIEKQKQDAKLLKDTLDALPWSDNRKQAVMANLNAQVLKRKNDAIRSNPEALLQFADIYSYFDEKTGKWDFSKLIDAKANSKVAEEIKQNLDKDNYTSMMSRLGGGGRNTQSSKKQDDFVIVQDNY